MSKQSKHDMIVFILEQLLQEYTRDQLAQYFFDREYDKYNEHGEDAISLAYESALRRQARK